jgi:hypothetical protein
MFIPNIINAQIEIENTIKTLLYKSYPELMRNEVFR